MSGLKTETNRLLTLRNKATPAPWIKRAMPETDFECFVQGPKSEGMAYACEILGDDYNGFGDDEQRMHDVEFVAASHAMADYIVRLQRELNKLKGV